MLLSDSEVHNGSAVQFCYVTPQVVLLIMSQRFQDVEVPFWTTSAISEQCLLALFFLLFLVSLFIFPTYPGAAMSEATLLVPFAAT